MNNNNINKLFATIVFLFSFVIYWMTMAPTVSLWDCGEFIACSYKLAVPHPPGAPLYLLVGRIFTLIPEFLIENIGRRVNLISVLSSALTVLFLYLSIVYLIREYFKSQEGFERYIPYIGAVVGALSFAFTHSFWFNAVEAEVYAPSMLFTGLCVWLIFYWSERSESVGNEKYLLLISYLVGLAIGVHLLNILALPMVLLIIYYRRFNLSLQSFLLFAVCGGLLIMMVYPGIVNGIPWIISLESGGFLLIILILGLIVGFIWALRNHRQILSLLTMSILLIIVGYSSYMMIYIRSNLDPNIDENNPETIERFISYLNREQYGEYTFNRFEKWKESSNASQYESSGEFFWRYQVNHMYIRYFLWNFAGIAEDGIHVDLLKFGLIPLFLGLLGVYYHFLRDWKHGMAVLVLFFMTGLAIVIYLNQPDPQPRERDYSYVGSFFAFSIWIGIGAAAVLEWFVKSSENVKKGTIASLTPWLMAVLLLVGGPLQMLAKNYHSHDRTGNYAAWDYAYNMLVSSDKNGIMLTNGDNDTFPLWYLQEVENIRPDVRVVNLSLLNTPWYIEQLKNKEPRVPISLSDTKIQNIGLKAWPEKKTFQFPIQAKHILEKEKERYKKLFNKESLAVSGKMAFEIAPKFFIPRADGSNIGTLRVQDLMILNILVTNQFRKPIYFAVTTSNDNKLDKLQDYLRMDGLLFKITTIPNWKIDPELMYDNLVNKFRYRGLNDPSVYFSEDIVTLVQNYRSAFFRLATYHLKEKNPERFQSVVKKCYEVMPPEVIPYLNYGIGSMMTAFAYMAEVYPLDHLREGKHSSYELRSFAELGSEYQYLEFSGVALEVFLEKFSKDSQDIHEFVRNFDPQGDVPVSKIELLMTNIRRQAREKLMNIYKTTAKYDRALELLENWQQEQPGDSFVTEQLKIFKALKGNNDS